MSRWRRFKVWLAGRLLGEPEEVSQEVEQVYAGLWPKHEFYEAQTKALLKETLLRFTTKKVTE